MIYIYIEIISKIWKFMQLENDYIYIYISSQKSENVCNYKIIHIYIYIYIYISSQKSEKYAIRKWYIYIYIYIYHLKNLKNPAIRKCYIYIKHLKNPKKSSIRKWHIYIYIYHLKIWKIRQLENAIYIYICHLKNLWKETAII